VSLSRIVKIMLEMKRIVGCTLHARHFEHIHITRRTNNQNRLGQQRLIQVTTRSKNQHHHHHHKTRNNKSLGNQRQTKNSTWVFCSAKRPSPTWQHARVGAESQVTLQVLPHPFQVF